MVHVWGERLSAEEVRDRPGYRGRLEHGDLRELRQRIPLPLEERRVPEGEQVIATVRAERAIDNEPLVLRQRHARQAGHERVRAHATGPHDRPSAMLRAVLRPDDAVADLRDPSLQHHPDPLALELLHRDRAEPRVHPGEDAIGGVQQQDRRLMSEIELRIHLPQRVVHEVAQGRCELDPDRTRADDHERQQLAATRPVGLA